MSSYYRVLALDGGGMRGVFTAAVIAALERDLSVRLTDHVELIVGTSTGGIIGLGLASGKSGQEMLNFYAREGREIFRRPRRVSHLWRPKYDRRRLDALLLREFGDLRLKDLSTAVCITAHELVAGTTRVWKDDHHPRLAEGGEQLVWKVAAATSAAPTYFAPFQLGAADSHVDGGIWANNPAMVGIAEAVHYGERALNEVRLLSVGTTTKSFRVESHAKAERMGLMGWVLEARELLLGGSASMASDKQAELLLPRDAYLRLNHERAGRSPLDDWRGCSALQELGEQVARVERQRVRSLLRIPSV